MQTTSLLELNCKYPVKRNQNKIIILTRVFPPPMFALITAKGFLGVVVFFEFTKSNSDLTPSPTSVDAVVVDEHCTPTELKVVGIDCTAMFLFDGGNLSVVDGFFSSDRLLLLLLLLLNKEIFDDRST